jgi:hypothetical protein
LSITVPVVQLPFPDAPVTATVAVAVAVPAEFVAVRVYVVVEAGCTVADPNPPTAPTVGAIDTVVAPVVAHASVEDPPGMIALGVAVKEVIVGAGKVTVTVTVPVTEAAKFVAVIVYVVVAAGCTVADPLTATVPTVGAMDTVVAPTVTHASVAEPPGATELGVAVKDEIVGGRSSGVTVIVVCAVAVPPVPVAVSV